tara:strand:+ start:2856 stop:3221 length:366 start_codon:yes stop_codon:yes gene_type:complete
MIYAPKFPLKFNDTSGFENVEDIKQLISFHLKNLIFTFPGEKISDPDYGIGIEKYLFNNFDDGMFNALSNDILNAIVKYLSYLEVVNVLVSGDPDLQTMNVKILYSLPNSRSVYQASFVVK